MRSNKDIVTAYLKNPRYRKEKGFNYLEAVGSFIELIQNPDRLSVPEDSIFIVVNGMLCEARWQSGLEVNPIGNFYAEVVEIHTYPSSRVFVVAGRVGTRDLVPVKIYAQDLAQVDWVTINWFPYAKVYTEDMAKIAKAILSFSQDVEEVVHEDDYVHPLRRDSNKTYELSIPKDHKNVEIYDWFPSNVSSKQVENGESPNPIDPDVARSLFVPDDLSEDLVPIQGEEIVHTREERRQREREQQEREEREQQEQDDD